MYRIAIVKYLFGNHGDQINEILYIIGLIFNVVRFNKGLQVFQIHFFKYDTQKKMHIAKISQKANEIGHLVAMGTKHFTKLNILVVIIGFNLTYDKMGVISSI